MEAVARAARDPLVGPLKLGVIPTLAPYLMPILLKPLRLAYPGLTIELWEDQTRALIEGLRNHRLDAALPDAPEITEIALFDEPLLAALPLDHPLAAARTVGAESLADEMLVLADGHCLAIHALAACGKSSHARNGSPHRRTALQNSMQAATLETLVNLVAAGSLGQRGIALRALEKTIRRAIKPHQRNGWALPA